jgi:hypothetical protein
MRYPGFAGQSGQIIVGNFSIGPDQVETLPMKEVLRGIYRCTDTTKSSSATGLRVMVTRKRQHDPGKCAHPGVIFFWRNACLRLARGFALSRAAGLACLSA